MKPNDGAASEARLPTGAASRGPLRSAVGTPVRTALVTVAAGFIALLACLVVLGLLAESIRDREVIVLDTIATPFLHGLASTALDSVMQAATFMGSNLAFPPLFAIAIIWLILAHRPREALFLAIACGGSLVLNELMKVFFARPRQQLAWAQVLPDFSFPSGHTMNAIIFYVAVALIAWSVFGRKLGVAAVVIAVVVALAVGVSRIYLGYHYLTDVVGGLLAGIAWLLVVGAAFRARPTWWQWGGEGEMSSRRPDGPGTAAIG
jgi:undecaprenyl-diphosphatase